jgi:hypothetical protein
MPAIDLSILNQRQTPAFYADVFANRPAAGFVGRIFVSTNTFAFYRDNGTGWDLIGGPGTGTITGSGAAGQVSYWNGASTITGSNDLFFDAVNGHLGIGTITPGTALDVKHDQSTVVQLEQITATNDIRIAFINSGVGLWRLGAFYNAGANDFGLFDIAAAAQPVTVKRTTGQVLIGTSTVGSGKLVVASATSDNGIQIVGANAPSLRIDSAATGPTKRIGLGISTAANNFIQGSVDSDMCIFNGSTTASPMLFGIYGTTNVQEAARISAARNFLIGTTTDGGQKLQISGGARATGYYLDGMIAGSGALYWGSSTNRVTLANYNSGGILNFEVNGGASAMTIDASGNLGLGITPNAWANSSKAIQISDASFWGLPTLDGYTSIGGNYFYNGNYVYIKTGQATDYFQYQGTHVWRTAPSGTAGNTISFTQAMTLNASGNLGLGVTPSAWGANPFSALQIGTDGGFIAGRKDNGNQLQIGQNAYYDGTNWIYTINGTASRYILSGNEYRWLNAPSGTAGNTITFTQQMTLVGSTGNLLIGTTTDAGQKLQVNGTATASQYSPYTNNTIAIPLNTTNYTIISYAFNGIIVIRDVSFGGSAVFLLDANAGALLISSNLGYTLTFTYSAGIWLVQKNTGGATTIYYNLISGV